VNSGAAATVHKEFTKIKIHKICIYSPLTHKDHQFSETNFETNSRSEERSMPLWHESDEATKNLVKIRSPEGKRKNG